MPKSLEEIIARSEELADWIEQWDGEGGVEVPVHEYLLIRAVRQRMRAEREIVDAVARARQEGSTWSTIGGILGTSGQAAQQRYGRLIASPDR